MPCRLALAKLTSRSRAFVKSLSLRSGTRGRKEEKVRMCVRVRVHVRVREREKKKTSYIHTHTHTQNDHFFSKIYNFPNESSLACLLNRHHHDSDSSNNKALSSSPSPSSSPCEEKSSPSRGLSEVPPGQCHTFARLGPNASTKGIELQLKKPLSFFLSHLCLPRRRWRTEETKPPRPLRGT